LVVLVGALIDAPVIAWAATLPDGVHDFFAAATRFGRSDWLLIPTGVIAIAVAFGDWRHVSRPAVAAWWEVATFAAVLFIVIAATGLATDLLKPIVGRLRPEFAGDSVFTFSPFTLGGYRYYSFPSGHATTMGAVAVFAAFAPGFLTIPIIVLTAVVAVSRVMIGVHFPSDVVGGALIGVGLGYLILRGMADAGIVFVVRENGRIGRRLGVVRRLRRRRAGVRALFRGLWKAWVGRST
jgi:undecaprenyl-diphosphatase